MYPWSWWGVHKVPTFERIMIMRAGRERSLWPLSTLSAQLECPDRTGMFTTPLKLFASNSVCLLSSTKCPDRTPVWNLHNWSAVIYLFVSNTQSSCCLTTSVTWKAVIGPCSSNTWEIICFFGLPCGIKYEPRTPYRNGCHFLSTPHQWSAAPILPITTTLCRMHASESRWEVDEKNTHCQLVVHWDGRENILVDNWARLGVERMGCNLLTSCRQAITFSILWNSVQTNSDKGGLDLSLLSKLLSLDVMWWV